MTNYLSVCGDIEEQLISITAAGLGDLLALLHPAMCSSETAFHLQLGTGDKLTHLFVFGEFN